QGIQEMLEEGAIASVCHRNTLLLTKAVEKLEAMLQSKSQRRQLAVIKLLLEYGALPGVSDARQEDPQEGRPSRIRLDPQLQVRMKEQQSSRDSFPDSELI